MKSLLLAFLSLLCTSSLFAQSKKTVPAPAPKPFVLGEIREIESDVLGEIRTLNIYLPDTYNAADSIRFPVIYLLDGSADEDFIHIAGLVQYNSFEWINRVPKSIVVGIATVDRRRDYTFPTSIPEDAKRYPTSGKSEPFMRFLETELQPFVDKTYKTSSEKTIIGQSLGGLLLTEILLKKTTLFSTYIIVSPSLWWNNGSLLDASVENLSSYDGKPIPLYIGVGKEGLTPTKIPRVMEVDANLLAEKLRNVKSDRLSILFDYLPEENHATILHQAVSNAFKKWAKPE